MAATVTDALRRFMPDFIRTRPPIDRAKGRAIWAITHCRTSEMGGHLFACDKRCTREYRYHSCNHRSCPQCGKQDTAAWVGRAMEKRVGAPYFMVTFTLPSELRQLFQSDSAKEMYQLFFTAASSALSSILANKRWLGAQSSGFTMVLHTWNQRLGFHPHIHTIVPGAGISKNGQVVVVKNSNFLVPQPALRRLFRARFRDSFMQICKKQPLPAIDPTTWEKDWGVHLQPFGDGKNIIKYLGRYVCRTAIGDARIQSITDSHVFFRWTDRAHGNTARTDKLLGSEFVKRYLRHVLPRGLRAIRYYGFCHPAAKKKRERIAFHTGLPLLIGELPTPPEPSKPPTICKCCGGELKSRFKIHPAWHPSRAPPTPQKSRTCA